MGRHKPNMFLIDSVDELHVFASAGYLATARLKYLVTNRGVITALLEMYKFHFFHFCWVMLYVNGQKKKKNSSFDWSVLPQFGMKKKKKKSPAVQFFLYPRVTVQLLLKPKYFSSAQETFEIVAFVKLQQTEDTFWVHFSGSLSLVALCLTSHYCSPVYVKRYKTPSEKRIELVSNSVLKGTIFTN